MRYLKIIDPHGTIGKFYNLVGHKKWKAIKAVAVTPQFRRLLSMPDYAVLTLYIGILVTLSVMIDKDDMKGTFVFKHIATSNHLLSVRIRIIWI